MERNERLKRQRLLGNEAVRCEMSKGCSEWALQELMRVQKVWQPDKPEATRRRAKLSVAIAPFINCIYLIGITRGKSSHGWGYERACEVQNKQPRHDEHLPERKSGTWMCYLQGWLKNTTWSVAQVWRFFESHLYTLADMFCGTRQVIDEHLITCSFLNYADCG